MSQMHGNRSERPPAPLGHDARPGIVSEIGRELLWLKLLRSVSLAIRPERLFVAAVMLVLMALVVRVPGQEWWGGESWSAGVDAVSRASWSDIAFGAVTLDMARVTSPFLQLDGGLGLLWQEHRWTMLLVAPFVLLIWGVGGCVISRVAACDVAQGLLVPWVEGRRFAFARTGSILFALAAPLIVVAAIWFLLAVGGWVLFSLPWVNVLGGMFYVLFLVASLIGVLVLAAYVAGFPLLVPAIACEGGDGIDAIARAYPYVFGKPLRYAAYGLVAILLATVATTVISYGAERVMAFASGAATTWTGERARGVLAAATDTTAGAVPDLPAHERATVALVRFWRNLVMVIVGAFAISYFFCSSTVLYMIMRRVCDGQDMGEVWMPGMIEGTMTMTMEARANVGGVSVRPGSDADAADET